MGLHLYSIHHAEHGIGAVERAAGASPGLGRRLVADHPSVDGAVVLATCNRLEVYVDAHAAGPELDAAVRDALGGVPFRSRHATEALWHLFGVGAGLDSMVVGEREIAGQLRRALKQAQAERTSTYLLTESIEQALRTSRRVAHLTELAATGRSVVGVGLDLLRRDWATSRVVVAGTGSYAGAVVSALRERGCTSVAAHSVRGRAGRFAQSHPGVVVASGGLVDALADADVLVTCRGTGDPVLTHEDAAALQGRRGWRPLDVVDLALARDVEAGVGGVSGITLLDLRTIQRHVPDASARAVARAHELVSDGVGDLVQRLRGRQMDPAVVALRDAVSDLVDDEVARLPQGRPVTGEEAAHALRRLAARLVHVPSVRARKAAEEGRSDEYLAALAEVYGPAPGVRRPVLRNLELGESFEAPAEPSAATGAVRPELADRIDDEACPHTGYSLDDLGQQPRRKAM